MTNSNVLTPTKLAIGLDCVIVAVTGNTPRVLTVSADLLGLQEPITGNLDALPSGPLDPARHPTMEGAVREWVEQQTSIKLGYVEQLYTFGDQYRDPRERDGGSRLISAAYLALVQERTLVSPGTAAWRNVYDYFPWEDWRSGRPPSLDDQLYPGLRTWSGKSRARRIRADVAFGLVGAPWDPERTLERYELLYEAHLVSEYQRDSGDQAPVRNGRAMALDHRRILATALGRLRGKIRYRPVVFELLPQTFTLLQLQRVVEALAGSRLHKQNFRRLVDKAGLVEGTGVQSSSTGGRPAELFRFRREVVRERPASGVRFPGAKW